MKSYKYLLSTLSTLFIAFFFVMSMSMSFHLPSSHAARGRILLSEPDGSPNKKPVYEIQVPNGTLSESGGVGSISIEPAQTAASQVEAEAGTEVGLRSWSPLRIWQAIFSATGPAIVAAPEKTTFVDADRIAGTNSESSNALTWWSWANIKTALTTHFDTLYFSLTGYAQVDTESELATAIAAVTPVIVARADITFTSNHILAAGQTYSALPGSVITTNYSVAGGGSNWTVHAGDVYVSTANYNEIAFLRESGTALTEVAGAADVDAAGKWAWEANKIYVRTTGSVDPDTLGAGLLVAGHTFDLSAGHLQDNGEQMFSAAEGEVIGISSLNPSMWGMATGATGATNQVAISNAIAAATSGSVITMPQGTFAITGLCTIDKAITIDARGCTLNFATNSSNQGIRITSSDVSWEYGTLVGPQYAASSSTQSAIYCYGTDSSNYLSNIKIHGTKISNWGFYGIVMKFVDSFSLIENTVFDIYQAGIQIFSCQNGTIAQNKITGPGSPAGAGVYGIALSRVTNEAGDLTTNPRSKDIVIESNIVKYVTNWEGLDSHSGERITFANNVVTGCDRGIVVGGSTNSLGDYTYGPIQCNITNNIIDSEVSDGSRTYGIALVGASGGGPGLVAEFATGCSVKGNTIKGYGLENDALGTAVLLRTTQGVIFCDNTIIQPSQKGLLLYHDNYNFSVTNNTFEDAWSDSLVAAYGIWVNAGYNTGTISGNTFSLGSKSATTVFARGMQIDDEATHDITIGPNSYDDGIPRFPQSALARIKFDSDGGRFIIKDTITYADFAAATTHNFLPTFQTGYVITDVWWSLDTEFSGGAVSAATLIFGVAGGDTDGFFPAENVFTGAGTGFKDSAVTSRGALLHNGTNFQTLQYFTMAATSLRAAITLTGDTGNNLTAGQATIWIGGYRVK